MSIAWALGRVGTPQQPLWPSPHQKVKLAMAGGDGTVGRPIPHPKYRNRLLLAFLLVVATGATAVALAWSGAASVAVRSWQAHSPPPPVTRTGGCGKRRRWRRRSAEAAVSDSGGGDSAPLR